MLTLYFSLISVPHLAQFVSPTTDGKFIPIAVVLVVISKANVGVIVGGDSNSGNLCSSNLADNVP